MSALDITIAVVGIWFVISQLLGLLYPKKRASEQGGKGEG